MKKIITFIAVLLSIVLVDFLVSRTGLPVNTESYRMGYSNFYDYAKATKGQKRIILIGGSSLGWGVSAEAITQQTGVLTLNGGLHADLGYRGVFSSAEDVLDKDNDIIVISPELALPAKDYPWSRSVGFCEVNMYVIGRYPLQCIGYSLNRIARIAPIIDKSSGPDYFDAGFNKFGDYVYRRPGINMVGKFSPDSLCSQIDLEALTDEYIPYYKGLSDAGYRIVYIPNFMPVTTCTDIDKLAAFHKLLFKNFGVKGFYATSQLFDEKYFYNSPYHLTQEGIALKTRMFLRQLVSVLSTDGIGRRG